MTSSLVQVDREELPVVETAASAMAASAKALIEAAYVVAARFPRNIETVRQRLLSECDRPGFAAQARYLKPVGNSKVAGLSIRFAEASLRAMGNLDVQQTITFDDAERRIVKVTARDLETNAHVSQDIIVEKTVERRKMDPTREKVGERKNTKGETVYILAATEDETLVKANAMLAKARRNVILGFLPGDIADECEGRIVATLAKQDAEDPKAALRKITDGFFTLGIDAGKLESVIGHGLDSISPAELAMLRHLYTAIRDGESTWADIEDAMAKRDADPKAAKGVAGLRERLGVTEEKKATP